MRVCASGDVPRHVAVIMDGNGRWAQARGLPRTVGHRTGVEAVREAVAGCLDAGVEILTLYAFSTDNWRRPKAEVAALMSVLQIYADKESRALARKGVEVRVLGETKRLDRISRVAVDRIQQETRGGDALRLNLMISYGGREEIVQAARSLAKRAAAGTLDHREIDAELFASALLTRDVPDPDLLIRTSGEQRISNFMLWQVAYTEMHVVAAYWPDFTREHLFGAILDYQNRERRFGRVPVP